MSPGAHLSHAARSASDAQRSLIMAVQHLEAAGATILPEAETHIAEMVEDTGEFATELLAVADEYSRAEVERAAALRPAREAAA